MTFLSSWKRTSLEKTGNGAAPTGTAPGGDVMQTSVIIQSNGSGKDDLDRLLKDGWRVVSVTANDGKSYNDFLVILERS